MFVVAVVPEFDDNEVLHVLVLSQHHHCSRLCSVVGVVVCSFEV